MIILAFRTDLRKAAGFLCFSCYFLQKFVIEQPAFQLLFSLIDVYIMRTDRHIIDHRYCKQHTCTAKQGDDCHPAFHSLRQFVIENYHSILLHTDFLCEACYYRSIPNSFK